MIDPYRFCHDNDKVIKQIINVMITNDVDPLLGEQILLYCAGMSAGVAMRPIKNNDWLTPVVAGWISAVEQEPPSVN